jgi:hypothetical protein
MTNPLFAVRGLLFEYLYTAYAHSFQESLAFGNLVLYVQTGVHG